MPIIGVKELKTQASSILQSLRKGKEKGYIVTVRGKPVARLVPIDEEELEDLILSMDNPKFKVFLEEARRDSSLSWKELAAEVKSEKVQTRDKKAS